MVLGLTLLLIIGVINVEWSIFRVAEIHDAANAAVRAAQTNLPDAAGCESGVIARSVQHAAPVISLPADSRFCARTFSGRNSTAVMTLSHDSLQICLLEQPTVYAPSHITAVVTDTVSPLGPLGAFTILLRVSGTTTTGAEGIPGTAKPDVAQSGGMPSVCE